MSTILSCDLRQRIVAAYSRGEGTQAEIAQRFAVCTKTVNRLVCLHHRTGRVAPKPHGGGHPAAFAGAKLDELRKLVEQHPDATLYELRETTGVSCSLVAVHNTLKRLKLPLKKSRSTPPSKTAPTFRRSVRRGANKQPPST